MEKGGCSLIVKGGSSRIVQGGSSGGGVPGSSMGQKISRIYGTVVTRPLQRYNVEHRAAKEISRIEDPVGPALRAPMYSSDRELLEQIRESNPLLSEATHRKHDDLHARLRDVYVTSEQPEATPLVNPARPLPLDRANYNENFIPGMMRIDRSRIVTRGKVTIEQAVQFLTDHSAKPDVHTAATISDTYRLNPETTASALKYFKVFKVFVPEIKEEVKQFDPRQAGKDWVDEKKENLETVFKFQQERTARVKLLKEKEEKQRKQEQQVLEDGSKKR